MGDGVRRGDASAASTSRDAHNRGRTCRPGRPDAPTMREPGARGLGCRRDADRAAGIRAGGGHGAPTGRPGSGRAEAAGRRPGGRDPGGRCASWAPTGRPGGRCAGQGRGAPAERAAPTTTACGCVGPTGGARHTMTRRAQEQGGQGAGATRKQCAPPTSPPARPRHPLSAAGRGTALTCRLFCRRHDTPPPFPPLKCRVFRWMAL
jgi:hypothetical protein